MRNLGLTFALIAVMNGTLFAQDVHFSNMEYSPLTLNPGLAGANNDMQVISNYRTQWNSVAAPFNTIAFSGDMRLNRDKRRKKGHLAAGLNFFNDQAGERTVSTNSIGITAAYHLMIDNNSTIGLGMNTSFGQRSLDASDGNWGNQYVGGGFNPAIPSNESFENAIFSFFSASSGIVYTYGTNESSMRSNDGLLINAGYAVFHVNRPSFSFIGNGEDPLFMRHALFANASIGLGQTNTSFEPGIYMQFQGPSREFLMGADYCILINEGSKQTGNIQHSSIAFGAFYRNMDALITRLIYNYAGFGIGMAYDFNISSLSEASRGRGGAEFFLKWTMNNSFGASSKARI
ncbi:MAG: PorP/SprF family type IX secretion system membrane protein [Crocinitomicaceae bacterium]|nr:PorP/SprF family type IX secretion system membrane protein [Crocinitomicaceae bacterium]